MALTVLKVKDAKPGRDVDGRGLRFRHAATLRDGIEL
jgi:hypothetical protein